MAEKSGRFKALYERGNHRVTVQLSILAWEQDNVYFLYSPALDLTGYGTNLTEAKKSFETTLQEFVQYTLNKKTVYKELERLGWTVNERKKRFHPPTTEQLLEDNETFRELQSRPGVRTTSRILELALI